MKLKEWIQFMVVWGLVIYSGYYIYTSYFISDEITTPIPTRARNIPNISQKYNSSNNLAENDILIKTIELNNNMTFQRKNLEFYTRKVI